MEFTKNDLRKVDDYTWEIPRRGDMKVPGRIFVSEKILNDVFRDESFQQVTNVATLPGIQNYSIAMPDVHEGYGFPVGGVAAFDVEKGVISPGGVGFDINCGVRIIATPYKYGEMKDKIADLTMQIYDEVPSGVGQGGRLKLNDKELDLVLDKGVDRMIELGYATEDDKKHCESLGRLEDVDSSLVSKTAKDRGRDQLGTIGAGNHFVEIQRVFEIFDEEAAKAFGLFPDQVTIMVHCGSRGLGHQIATDYIKISLDANHRKYKIPLADPQLACTPFKSDEGQRYWRAMSAGANFAWSNRQLITWEIREAWRKIIGDPKELRLVYDVAHNLAKLEEYPLAQTYAEHTWTNAENSQHKSALLVVHRKGATRAFPPNHPETPELYKRVGQPVLIPGSMGTASFVLAGQEGSLKLSFGSSAHGAGRLMSRTKAKRMIHGRTLKEELEKRGIVVRAGSFAGLAEEAPVAYKDVDEVVNVTHNLGISKKVVKLVPLGVVKG